MTDTSDIVSRSSNPQCIHIPDGSVVVSGELFDMACAAINERDRLLELMHVLEEHVRQLQHERDQEHAPETPAETPKLSEGAHADWLAGAIGLVDACAERRTPETRACDAMREAGNHVFCGATPNWIDHAGDCDALPCICGLSEWLNANKDLLGITLSPTPKAGEHLYMPVSSGNDACQICDKPKRECSAVNGGAQ
jgi:hypothetical protein